MLALEGHVREAEVSPTPAGHQLAMEHMAPRGCFDDQPQIVFDGRIAREDRTPRGGMRGVGVWGRFEATNFDVMLCVMCCDVMRCDVM